MTGLGRFRMERQRRRARVALGGASTWGTADAFTWAVRLHRASSMHPEGPAGFNAAGAAIDGLLAGLAPERVAEVACALALLPRISRPVQPLLLEHELDRLDAAVAWSWSS